MAGISKLIIRSVTFYRKQLFYQVIIIVLLAAVITGSLLTGSSVRKSLEQTASARLGNTGILISSGVRFFNPRLAERLKKKEGLDCAGFLEISGTCRGLISQKEVAGINIYAVGEDFFRFHGNDTLRLKPGEILVNERLANSLNLNSGDELVIRFTGISDIPADAPFSPVEEPVSFVMKAGEILSERNQGDFSLAISQITPMNLFIRVEDMENSTGKPLKFNRIIVNAPGRQPHDLLLTLNAILEPEDIGLSIRKTVSGAELVSDRVFIDQPLLRMTEKAIPSSSPVITYLANSIASVSSAAPYSFVAAVPASIYPAIPGGDKVLINRWLADDLNASEGDTLKMTWYSPDSLNHLVEKSGYFMISGIVDLSGIWNDPSFMPDFPGIAGAQSCSDWNAGVPVDTRAIRDKDEEYWNIYRGTPKAFISYEKGREIWGSNYGPATAIRFPDNNTPEEIRFALTGKIDPEMTGFAINNIKEESIRAAEESVDFSTLFISLGFFLILASIILLSFAVSYYILLRENDIKTFFALGFRNKMITKLIFLETAFAGFTGSLVGSLSGYFISTIIIKALNSVWSGAVQTDTLDSYFSPGSVLAGFAITFILILALLKLFIRRSLKRSAGKEKAREPVAAGKILILSIMLLTLSVILIVSGISGNNETLFFFIAGGLLLFAMILFWRQFIINRNKSVGSIVHLSKLYYSFYPSHAVMPVLFIAAGIFAFMITTVNRKDFNEDALQRSSGTGGFLIWTETSIPLKEDLNSVKGRKSLGLDDDSLRSLRFVQMKRSQGNHASCLNLNHITAPPLLGVDPGVFIRTGSFSFSKALGINSASPWEFLDHNEGNVIYGIADQTVLDWGLKISVGDTLIMRTETGQPVRIIIAAGLQSSVFQGYVLIGKENFNKYFPSVSGSHVFLADGDPAMIDTYLRILPERLSVNGVTISKASDRLKAFYTVTNTYLSVFGVFGALGMITGVSGLGFVLLRNYARRKRELAVMIATGFSMSKIRRMLFSEQMMIISAGVLSGVIPALVATIPSLKSNHDIPWLSLFLMVLLIFLSAYLAISVSLRSISGKSLISALRKE